MRDLLLHLLPGPSARMGPGGCGAGVEGLCTSHPFCFSLLAFASLGACVFCISQDVRVCLALAPSSVSLCPQDSTPLTDTDLDNYSLLILLVSAAPGAVFFILVGAPSSRPSQPAFLRRQSTAGSDPERERLSGPRPGNLSEAGLTPPPTSAPLPLPSAKTLGA